MKILFVGDVVGRPGRRVLARALSVLEKRSGRFDFVVVNCENAASGRGMTDKVMEELFALGADGMTSGNHIWDKNLFYAALDSETRVVRPANYPAGAPGSGYTIVRRNGKRLGLLNLQGRVFMPPLDCPFRAADAAIEDLKKMGGGGSPLPILVDFHAEATSEKKAMALYLDGRVSAVLGTHTHVQTADERVLTGGSAFITDAGMTGGHGGVIGVNSENVISRFLSCMPAKHEVCEAEPRINAVVLDVDEESGRAAEISRINEAVDL